jgi:hypothetical protein
LGAVAIPELLLAAKKTRADAWAGALARTGFAYLAAAAETASGTAAKLIKLIRREAPGAGMSVTKGWTIRSWRLRVEVSCDGEGSQIHAPTPRQASRNLKMCTGAEDFRSAQ